MQNNTQMYREILQEPAKLQACLSQNRPLVTKLCEQIRDFEPTCAVLSARGTSYHACKFGKYLLETYCGLPVSFAAPSVITKYQGALNLRRTLVIGVSQSGMGVDVCSLIERGNRDGAITVGFTNTDGSLLSKQAQVCLNLCADLEEALAATKTFTNQMALFLLLAAELSQNTYLLDALEILPAAVKTGLSFADTLAYLAPRYRFCEDCHILARGQAYPLAKEMELKIQETSHIRSHAFAASNFTHGPMILLDKDVPVFAFAMDAATDDSVLDMLARVRQAHADCLLFTNKADLQESPLLRIVRLPSWCEGIIGTFAAIPMIQLLACEISVCRGFTPDAPQGLSKVTVTI